MASQFDWPFRINKRSTIILKFYISIELFLL